MEFFVQDVHWEGESSSLLLIHILFWTIFELLFLKKELESLFISIYNTTNNINWEVESELDEQKEIGKHSTLTWMG